jgi:accessory gene regulator B
MIDAFCDKLTCVIRTNVQGIDDEKAEIINFGIKSIVSEVSKLIIILLSAYLFGIFNYVIIAIASHGLYRIYAGGFHAKTHLMCLTTGAIIIYGNVLLSMYIGANFYKAGLIYLIIYILNCFMIYRYAPADVEEKPIISMKLRKKLRVKSFVVMSLIIILSYFVIIDPIIAKVLLISTLFESITLMPLSYKLVGCKYGYRVI